MFGLTVCVGRMARRVAAIAAVSLLVFTAGAASASAETRTLKFYNLHTRERAEIVYKRNGRYIADGLKQINWFLRDWRRNKPTQMDPRLLDLVWEAYRQSGSRDYINVISAFRSPATNSMLRSRSSGVAKNSQHTLGRALDFFLPDVPLKKMREIGLKMQVGGVGFYPKSGSPFVHFDVGSARHWPRMSRRELLAVFPSGGTVHVPSDGKPLPGYQQALASYKQRVDSDSIQAANAEAGSSGGGRSLLAALFGGGADEDEDNAVAAASPAPRAPVRAAPAPRTQVAAVVPSRRPAMLETGVALPVRDDFDVSAPMPQAGIPEETQVAELDVSRIPLPTFAPGRGAPPALPPASGDTVSTLVAALESQAAEEIAAAPIPGQLAYSVPTPRDRPPFETILQDEAPTAESVDAVKEILTAAAAPASKPEAVAPAQEDAAATGLMLTTSLKSARPALAEVAAPSSPSGKTGRVLRSQPREAPQPVTVDVEEAIDSRIEIAALVTDPDLRAETAVMAKPAAGPSFRKAPSAVFTTGFAPERTSPAADRFVGSAVQFLPMAKFE